MGSSPVDMRVLAGSLQESSQSVMMLCSQPGQGLAQFKLKEARPGHSEQLSELGEAAESVSSQHRASDPSSTIAPGFQIVDMDAVDQDSTPDTDVEAVDQNGDANLGDERKESYARRRQGHGQRRRRQKWLQNVQAPTP